MNLAPYLGCGLFGLNRLRKHIRRGHFEHAAPEVKDAIVAGLLTLALRADADPWVSVRAITCVLQADCRNLIRDRVAFRRLRQRANRKAGWRARRRR